MYLLLYYALLALSRAHAREEIVLEDYTPQDTMTDVNSVAVNKSMMLRTLRYSSDPEPAYEDSYLFRVIFLLIHIPIDTYSY